MPFILGVCGFGGRAVARDRITVLAGSLTYSDSVLPTNSESTTSIGGSSPTFVVPWYNDQTAGRYQPTGQMWMHARYLSGANSATVNDTLRLGVGSNGAQFVAISTEDSTHKLTVRVGGVLRATAATEALSVSTWARLHLHISGYSEGDTVRVYTDGDLSSPVVSYTLTGTDEANLAAIGTGRPNEFYVVGKTGDSGARYDDFIAFDPTVAGAPAMSRLLEPSVKEVLPTGNGADQDWGGSYTDIDERPGSDTDKITATAVAQQSTFTFPAIAAENVYGVKLLARVTRSGTDAGANIGLVAVNGSDDEVATMAAPGDGDVQHIFQAAPDATDWSPASFDATEFGFLAVT